jgi:hypothetical protein
MLAIRKEQIDVLSKVEVQTVENRTLEHIRKTYPKEFNALGDEKTREVIQYGVNRAATYRFKGNPDVLKYIEVMVLFGRDFDADSQLPWVGEILGKPKKAAAKIAVLHEEAIKRWKSSQNPAAD